MNHNNINNTNATEMGIGIQNLDLSWRTLLATVQTLIIQLEEMNLAQQSLQLQQEEILLHRKDYENDMLNNKQNLYQISILESILETLVRIEKKL